MAGLKAGIQAVNASGGVLGRPLKLSYSDNQEDPTTTVSLLLKAFEGGQKPALVATCCDNPEALAICSLIQRYDVINIAGGNGGALADTKKCGNYFSYDPTAAPPLSVTAQIIKKEGKGPRVAALIQEGSYQDTLVQVMPSVFKQSGLELVGTVRYDPAATNLVAQLEAVARLKPDVLLVSGFTEALGPLLQARLQVLPNVPVVGDTGMGAVNLPQLVTSKSALKDIQVTTYGVGLVGKEPNGAGATTNAMQAILQELGGKPLSATTVLYSPYYDIPWVFKAAAERAKSVSGAALVKALGTFNGDPPTNPGWITYDNYAYTPTDHDLDQASTSNYGAGLPTAPNKYGQVQPAPN